MTEKERKGERMKENKPEKKNHMKQTGFRRLHDRCTVCCGSWLQGCKIAIITGITYNNRHHLLTHQHAY